MRVASPSIAKGQETAPFLFDRPPLGDAAGFSAYPSSITFFGANVNRQTAQIFSRNFVLDIWGNLWYYNHVRRASPHEGLAKKL